MQIYGAAVADKLDNRRGILKRRFYRQHCTPEMGSYTKDLTSVSNDLSSVFILDNSPAAYRAFPGNSTMLFAIQEFCINIWVRSFFQTMRYQ